MKSTELRLGNLFIEKYSRQIIEVEKLEKNAITFSGKFKGEWQADPMPLNEDILLKFGFKRFPWGLVKNELLFKDNIIKQCQELTIEIGNGFKTSVKYVHQLQNLYFALTLEELKINTQ